MTGVFLFPTYTMQSNILETFFQGLAEEVACIFKKRDLAVMFTGSEYGCF